MLKVKRFSMLLLFCILPKYTIKKMSLNDMYILNTSLVLMRLSIHELVYWTFDFSCYFLQNWYQCRGNFQMESNRQEVHRLCNRQNASAPFTPRYRMPRMLLGECRTSVEGGSTRCLPYIHLPQMWRRSPGKTRRISGRVHYEIYSDDDSQDC